jgi:hypothetical protein
LAERDAGDVDDVGGEGDGGLRIGAVGKVGAEGLGETGEVLVEGKETE